MTKAERAKTVQKILNKIYPKTPVPLNHKNVYELLIAVLLSAQCTDERVNKVTPKLFGLANNPKQMSKIPVNKIYGIIKPCGLGPKKLDKFITYLYLVKIILQSAKILKTSRNYLGLATRQQVLLFLKVLVSQHSQLILIYIGSHKDEATSGKMLFRRKKTQKISKKKNWNKLHLQIIFYGREYCQARSCYGLICKICKTCYPKRKKPIKIIKA